MMLLRLPVAAMPESGDPFHPHVRLPVSGAWSRTDLDEVVRHLQAGCCVHVTLTIPHRRLLSFVRRRSTATADSNLRDRLEDLAGVAGPDASRVTVRFEHEPSALRGGLEGLGIAARHRRIWTPALERMCARHTPGSGRAPPR